MDHKKYNAYKKEGKLGNFIPTKENKLCVTTQIDMHV
jgi:hypothetical protein